MQSKSSYTLSDFADSDLVEIFEYSKKEFGTQQGKLYLEEIEKSINLLCKQPHLGKNRDEIKMGLFSIKCNSHIIFYRIRNNRIFIVRVLHKSRDIPSIF